MKPEKQKHEEKKGNKKQRKKNKVHEPDELNLKGPKDYEKIRILGRGGVGIVYLVREKSTGHYFAMKVLDQNDMIRRNKVKRVLTEREILATTEHPFIVSLKHSFQTKSRLYFIMDYCAGGEFYNMIQKQPFKCLTEDQTRFYATEVLLALEYLHKMGFIYRDLKPENIILDNCGHIRLTDFDLSKASAASINVPFVENEISIKASDIVSYSFVGTTEYMAPEIIDGVGYGSSVDWWTLGILMYEMLYGVPPFHGSTQQEIFKKIKKGDVKFPTHPRCSISKNCKSLIRKLLEKKPKKRLGFKDCSTIKEHPFFKVMPWSSMESQTPPIVPDLDGPLDFRYFPEYEDSSEEEQDGEERVDPTMLDKDHPFKIF